MEGLVRLVGVASALEVFIPEFEAAVEGGSEELVVALHLDDARHFVLVSAIGLKLLLHHNKVVTAFLGHLLI